MPLSFIRADITRVECDAFAVPTDISLSGGGNVEASLFGACPELRLKAASEYERTGRFPVYVENGADRPAAVFTYVPRYNGNNEKNLEACVYSALLCASEHGCDRIALPLIGAGANGFPVGAAFSAAIGACRAFIERNDADITLVFYDRPSYSYIENLFGDVKQYISDNEIKPQITGRERGAYNVFAFDALMRPDTRKKARMKSAAPMLGSIAAPEAYECEPAEQSLDDYIKNVDRGFSETLLDLIDKSGMTDVQCYKRANVDRKLFSKIRSSPDYRPKKSTALSFCIALRLSLDETQSLLEKAGYTLSKSDKRDLIVEYFIKNKNYDIFSINEALFAFDQNLLGV